MREGTINRIFRSSFPEAEETGFRTNAWKFSLTDGPDELRPLHSTLLHALATAAKLEDKIGITLLPERKGDPTHLSYRELYHKATYLAETLKEHGVQPGDRVMLVLPTSLDFAIAFFAIQFAGAIVVPGYPPAGLRLRAGLDRLGHIANHAGVRLCVTCNLIKPVMGELALRAKGVEQIVTMEDLGAGKKPDKSVKARAQNSDFSFIQYTSGSTGNPKGVLLTHKNLCANIQAIGQALRINREDVVVNWCPLYHDMGLIGTFLFSIYWRTPYVLMSPTSFLQKPSRWLQAIHDYRGTLSPAPNFGYGMCVNRVKPEEREGLDLSCWRMAMNGAEPVNYRTLVDFGTTYKAHGFKMDYFLPVYGLAEATLAACFPRPGDAVRYEVVDRQELANGRSVLASGKGSMAVVSVGRKVPGHEILIVDEEGCELEEREVGHIVVAGDSVMHGYYGDPTATAKVVSDGWLWTGDLGYQADDNLFVTGRAKDLIIVRGRNIYAEDIERIAERIEHVRPGGIVAFGVYDEEKKRELVLVVAETKLEDEQEIAALAQKIAEEVAEFCAIDLDEVIMVGPGTIPKTSSGKRQRSLCRAQYLDGSLRPAALGKMELGLVFARAKAGMFLMRAKGLFKRGQRRERD